MAVANFHPAHQRSKAPVSPWPVCISGFDTLFSMALLTDGKRDFLVGLICLSRLLGWPKRAYAFFPEYIQQKNAYALFGQGYHFGGFAAFLVL